MFTKNRGEVPEGIMGYPKHKNPSLAASTDLMRNCMKPEKIKFLTKALVYAALAIFSLAWGAAPVFAQETEGRFTSLAITGPSSVVASSSANYAATATFSTGTSRDVTGSASWSLSSTLYATISATGVLTTRSVTRSRAVVITATFSANGLTRRIRKRVVIMVPPPVSLNSLSISGPTSVASNSDASYTARATFSNGTTQDVTNSATWAENSTFATISSTGVMTTTAPTSNQSVMVTASYTSGTVARSSTLAVTITAGSPPPPSGTTKSINSTSQNRDAIPSASVPEQILTTQNGFNILATNDLGMHCGDLDHRVASILPPFNVLHSLVIQKGTSTAPPEILTSTDIDVLYSASSNPNDPALSSPIGTSIFKTNFWDPNPAAPSVSLAFDGYEPFYPPSILTPSALGPDMGLPAPDLAELYPLAGTGVLVAAQQEMPGKSSPYSANMPQPFKRFDTDFPFFVNFPFGYRLTSMNWFAADGIPVTPYDDFGRKNSYPLMRVQAKTKNTALTGTSGAVVASVDAVVPVSDEAICYTCHTSSADGGGGNAACIPGIDGGCVNQGSPRSGTPFVVARTSDDSSNLPMAARLEWAADTNIIRLHDAKHGTSLQSSTPVVCQTCHYTPALDLAHVGPLGPGDAAANRRDQKVHRTNSRVMHAFHGQFNDLFPDMPPPNNAARLDPATGKPTVNTFVQNQLNASCYQCHPGKQTQCLRGVMASNGMVCQDCHGGMTQVGNDFSLNLSASKPFPGGADLTRRVPWAHEPACQSCHTGDAVSNIGLSDPNVIRASDGIRLLQAYRTNDTNAKPISASNKRFAEETASNGNGVLYRMSKGHSGVFCEACHGSTHAEWPVKPESGSAIANDNMTAIRLQGHTGKIQECSTCHTAGSLPVSLGGPHGMHPVGDSRFVSGHENLVSRNRAECQACHGQRGEGTVLSKVSASRSLAGRTLTVGQQVSCNLCHGNPL